VRDLVVVGGGPVGLAAAIAARLAGLAATVVETRRPPVDKACGEGLMPEGVAALAALGVDATALGVPFRGIRYRSEFTVADAEFPAGALGVGIRRTALRAALRERALGLGVELLEGECVEALTDAGVRTARGEIEARWVAGADGLHSKVRAWAGLERRSRRGPVRRFGVRRHCASGVPARRVEVVFGRRAEAYLTPVGATEMGVALLWSGAAKGFDDLLATRFPAELRDRLAGTETLSRDRGAGPFAQRTRGVVAGRIALVGDAAGYVDALTGEGLALGLAEARALVDALVAGDLSRYALESKRLRRRPEAITRLALFMARRPALRRRVVAAFAADPELFAALLGALGCGRPLTAIGAGAFVRFGARLLSPPPPVHA